MKWRFLLFLLLACCAWADFSTSDKKKILEALDNPEGVTLLGGKLTVFRLDMYGNLDDENPIKSTTERNEWTVQKGAKYNTSPVVGDTCVRSALGTGKDYDARQISLTFQVTGPGTFGFFFRTSTYSAFMGDYLIAYIDGQEAGFQADGYDEEGTGEYNWTADTEEEDGENHIFLTIPAGPVAFDEEDGDPREYEHKGDDALWQHEVTFVFYKDEPYYDDYYDSGQPKSSSYVPDGPFKPVKPVKADYDGDMEAYNYDLEIYNEEELPYYNTALANFGNCVWLDGFTWEPAVPTLEFLADSMEVVDEAGIPLATNAEDLNYQVRYTTDGSVPTADSPLYDSEGGILVTRSCTLTAKMFANATTAYEPELVATASVIVTASEPVLAKSAREDDSLLISASNPYDANVIRFTTDGSAPTERSPVWSADLVLTEPATIQAICTREGVSPSAPASLTVIRCDAPTVPCLDGETPSTNGIFTGDALTVTALAPEGATLWYSLDGAAELEYTTALTLADGQTVALRARQDGCLPSEPVTVTARQATELAVGPGLVPGWNLVAIPLTLADASASELLQTWPTFSVDSETGAFVRATALAPGQAVLLFVPADSNATVTLRGIPAAATPRRGWNLLPLDEFPANTTPWRWDGHAFQAVTPDAFEPGKPYLFLVK